MMSFDNSIVRKIYGTVIPLEGSVCMCVCGGGSLIIIFLVTYARHQQLLFPLKISGIPRCVPDALYKVRTLDGIWGLSPCMESGAKPVAIIVLGHSKELK